MSTRGTTFMGFGIRIDIMSQAALFAFKQLTTRALVFVGAITQVADEFLKFEKVMADLSRLMVISAGTTTNLESRMSSLGSQILQTSNESIFSFEQVAEALSYLMRAGYTSSEAMDELSKSMLLATSVGMELAEASRTLVRLQNMFRYAGQDTTNVVDQLAQAEMLFMMTTEDMNTALNMAGAVGAEAGFSLAQLATTIGVLYSAGLNASTAGTVMRRAIAAVLDISGPAGEEIAALGINMDYFSSLIPLDRLRVLGQYITAIKDPQDRLSVAFEIFGIRGVNILPVLESLMTDFDGLALSIQSAEGIANMAAETFKTQLYTQLIMVTQAVQNAIVNFGIWTTTSAQNAMSAAIALGGALALLTTGLWANTLAIKWNTLVSKLNYIAKLGSWAVSGIKIGVDAAETTGLWAKALALKATAGGYMKNMWAVLKGIPGKIATGALNILLAGTYGILSLSIKIATFATKAFFKALGPIGLVLSLIAAVIMVVQKEFGGMQGLMKQFRPIINQFANFFKFLGQAIMEVAEAIMPLVTIVLKLFMSQIKFLLFPLRILMMIFKVIIPVVVMLAKLIGEIAEKFMTWIESTGILTGLMKFLEGILNFVFKIVKAVMNIFIGLANVIIRIINIGRRRKGEEEMALLEKLGGPEEVGTMMEADSTAPPKEPSPDTDLPDESETPPEGGLPPPGSSGLPTPTGTADESVRKSGGGGRGGGDSFLLNIYIVPELAEFWDAAAFGESLVKGLAIEMKRSRGVYLS